MTLLGERQDPILSHSFLIAFVDSSSTLAKVGTVALGSLGITPAGGFSECEGLEGELAVEEREVGGSNDHMHIFPTRHSWSKLTLRRGVTLDNALWEWFYGFVEGRGQRRDGMIVLHDARKLPRNVWTFRNGIPSKYSGPSLNAGQNNVAIEALEITHEGLEQTADVGLGIAAVETFVSAGRSLIEEVF